VPKKPDRYVSKSQIEAFTSCQRKWGFDKLDGIRFPKPAADLGNEVHDVLEEYVKNDVHPEEHPAPPPGKYRIDPRTVALRAIASGHVPEPATGRCEDPFEFTDEAGITYYGFADWHDFQSVYDHLDGSKLTVLDYKTTGNLKYAHTPETLVDDVQAMIYARAFMQRYCTETADLEWLYISTREDVKTVRLVEATLTMGDVLRGWQPISDAGRAIYNARDRFTRAHQLPQNLGHCTAYGGCEYQGMCLSAKQLLALGDEPDLTVPVSRLVHKAKQANKDNDMGTMLDLLKKKAAENGRDSGEAPAEPAAPPTMAERAVGSKPSTTPPRPAPSSGGSVMHRLRASKAAQTQQPTEPKSSAPKPGRDPAKVMEHFKRVEGGRKFGLYQNEDGTPKVAGVNVNAPETADTDGHAASKAQEEIDKLKADLKKAKTAGAKASKEGIAQILASAVQGQGIQQGIAAADYWLDRFGEKD